MKKRAFSHATIHINYFINAITLKFTYLKRKRLQNAAFLINDTPVSYPVFLIPAAIPAIVTMRASSSSGISIFDALVR